MKLFFTCGTQLPFERLYNVAYKAACELRGVDVTIQNIIKDDLLFPKEEMSNFHIHKMLSMPDFHDLVDDSDLIISHAGMGNIITFVERNAKFVIFPRNKVFNEHRNDHQMDTAYTVRNKIGIKVILDETELYNFVLDQTLLKDTLSSVQYDYETKLKEFGENINREVDTVFL